jgi:hypothetical protein
VRDRAFAALHATFGELNAVPETSSLEATPLQRVWSGVAAQGPMARQFSLPAGASNSAA